MHVFPADAPYAAAPVAGDAVADPADAAELFDVEMHEFARALALVPHDGRPGVEGGQARQAEPLNDARDRAAPELQTGGDLDGRPALPAQPLDLAHQLGRGGPRDVMRPTGTIAQPLVGAADPGAGGLRRDVKGAGDRADTLAELAHLPNDLGSTPCRRACILVDVHPGLLRCGDGRLATTSFAVGARGDNLVGLHS